VENKKAGPSRVKRTIVLAIVFALGATYSLTTDATTIAGTPSCGDWVSATQENQSSIRVDRSWLLGFLSGLAVGQKKDFIRTDNKSMFLWVDNYCRSNPLNNLADAGDSLANELKKRNGL
jgi:hypothetical protein